MLGLGAGTFENWGDTGTEPFLLGHLFPAISTTTERWICSHQTRTTQKIRFLRGLGNGTFEPAVAYATVDDFTGSLLLTDLNQDGRPDLVHYSRRDTRRSPFGWRWPRARWPDRRADPAAFGGDATLTASVTPVDATGTITLYDGALIVGKAATRGRTGRRCDEVAWCGRARPSGVLRRRSASVRQRATRPSRPRGR